MAGLRIHTCLSPCGDWDISSRRIVQQSLETGLDLIAICDHNTVENARARHLPTCRPAYGIVDRPGLIPVDLEPDEVEISRHVKPAEAHKSASGIGRFARITGSDAHFIGDIGNV